MQLKYDKRDDEFKKDEILGSENKIVCDCKLCEEGNLKGS